MVLLLLAACDYGAAPKPGDTTEVVFEVPKGSSARGLGPELAGAGLVQSADDWTWYLRLGADGSCIKAGKHRASPGMTAEQLLAALCGVPIPDDVPFTVVEGWRRGDIDAALAAKGLIEAGQYLAATEHGAEYQPGFPVPEGSLEGYLYPETYQVTPDRFEVKTFVTRQLSTFGERFGAGAVSDPGTRPFAQVVIVASMVEREERTPANRPLVADIMWKRLDAGWNLGIDATSRYPLPDWNDEPAFLKRLFDPADPYNTRLRAGLPPTAIGNPGAAALDAALHPEKTDYWYYLHDATGTIHPTKTVAEHEAAKRKWLR